MIPAEKAAAVTRALKQAFGVSDFDEVRTISLGVSSALVLRIVVKGTPYLLRIILRNDTTTERHYTCMRLAAAAGLAPQVRYANIEDRISITDFIEAVPFPRQEALARIPTLLRSLHALPAFPRTEAHINTTCTFLLAPGPARDGLLRKFQELKPLPEDELAHLLALHAQLTAAYPHDEAELVSSHNDLFKPDNILFDGHRVSLIDWEAAFLNDRYAELAVVANLIVTTPGEQQLFLHRYFGHAPTEYESARFFLMQQIAHLFYATVFLMQSASAPPPLPEELTDLPQRFWTGQIVLESPATKRLFGEYHWQQLRHKTQQPQFHEALGILS